jgi:Flp pilus assembly protein TadB
VSPVALLAASAIGLGAAAVAATLFPPTRRLAPRVRPYAIVARTALGHAPEPVLDVGRRPSSGSTFPRLFGPPLRAVVRHLSRAIESRGDERIARQLRQAGYPDAGPDDYRVRQVVTACVVGVVAAGGTELVLRRPALALVAGVAGFVFGASRVRRRLERAIADRAARMRLELYTVNHLLAMHVRTGAGAMQAVQRVVDRGHGAVVEELAEVLTWTRSGMGEADAFRRAAELTPEPSAARAYQLLAGGVERGVDLGAGLLALSADIRDARREQLHKDAVRRRAAMLVPTIAILAPIMLLFIAAPLPSIVLGHR